METRLDDAIRKKIRHIKIYTKRIMQSSLSGDYLSAFRGSGLEFDQLREYQMGDDIRFIDWNSSAKMNKIMVKRFIEERDRTIILAIDVSKSSHYSSQHELRKDSIAQLAASLALVAQENKDKVGALFFSNQVEKWIPPKRGNLHIGNIMKHLFSFKPRESKTSISEALRFLIGLKKRNSVVFMISDWIDEKSSYEKLLAVTGIEYDFIAIRMLDSCERVFPNIGFIEIQNPETGQVFTVTNTNKKKHRLNTFLSARLLEEKKMFGKCNISTLDLSVGKPFIKSLVTFFHQRNKR